MTQVQCHLCAWAAASPHHRKLRTGHGIAEHTSRERTREAAGLSGSRPKHVLPLQHHVLVPVVTTVAPVKWHRQQDPDTERKGPRYCGLAGVKRGARDPGPPALLAGACDTVGCCIVHTCSRSQLLDTTSPVFLGV